MAPDSNEIRIVAIAIRSQRLGFAVLEGALGLLDWRTIHYQHNSASRIHAATTKVASLLELCAPSAVVVEQPRLTNAPNAPNVTALHRSIERMATVHVTTMAVIARKHVRETFRDFRAKSKDDIAAVLVQMFPELRPKLPPKRKIWKGEHPIMPIFDAIAIAVTYLDHLSERDSTPA
jgi:Holliday junction resolvasome RuvABC endonuclease subunit